MRGKRKHNVHEEDFTLKLAIQDTLPVLFFLGSMVVVTFLYPSILFVIGASCSLIAGVTKVIWKFIMALKMGNKKWLSSLFIPFQCVGFSLMLISLIVDRRLIHLEMMWKAVCSFPAGLFFLAGILGMAGMIILAMQFDQSVKSHWKAQWLNMAAQGCFFIGLLLLL
ncbi:MAG: hypothetical protein Q4F05_11895 [bacterium]|nr:hypothetical protein [bacterium]